MKKIYILLLTLTVTSLSFGQITLFQDSFETGSPDTSATMSEMCTDGGGDFFTVTDGTNIGTNYSVTGADGTYWLAAQDTDGTPECNSDVQTIEYNNIDISTGTNMTLAFIAAEDDDGTNQDWDADTLVYFETDIDNSGTYTKVFQFAANGATNTEPGVDSNFDGIVDGTLLSSIFQEFTYAVPNGSTLDLRITFEKLNAGDEDISIDNIRIIDGYAPTSTISISTPSNNSVIAPGTTNVNVEWATTNTSGSETVDVIVNGTTTNNATSPFAISTADGTTYNVTVNLINGGSTVASDNISFSVGNLTQVANITALRADVDNNGAGSFYEITGASLLTHTDGFRSRKWFQDSSISGVLIYDEDGIITTTYAVGDMVSGLKGYSAISNGVLRFIPTQDSGVIDSSGNAVVAQTVTITDFNANPDTYESEFIELLNVSFVEGDGTATFSTGTNYTLTDGTNTAIKRTDFYGADYIGEIIPSTQLPSVSGVSGEYQGTSQLYVRSLADITLTTGQFSLSEFSISPNPAKRNFVNITSTGSGAIQANVFDILGKQVINATVANGRLDVSPLNTGVYIVKLTQGAATTTKKLIIQ
ncbi:T9SS type A sorting domain-containing protein [Flavobacteriaceae bacterium]|nr:T9SS type A sorting domain-containing protein [Flavobacteriaceae bacterium]